jgi:hypothetical protein
MQDVTFQKYNYHPEYTGQYCAEFINASKIKGIGKAVKGHGSL